jgi:hypothetical protein
VRLLLCRHHTLFAVKLCHYRVSGSSAATASSAANCKTLCLEIDVESSMVNRLQHRAQVAEYAANIVVVALP